MKTTKTYTQVRQAKNGAFGWIVSILGEDYLQTAAKAEACESADKINERCAGMTIGDVRDYYKLGNYRQY